jgi:hypothetical protein
MKTQRVMHYVLEIKTGAMLPMSLRTQIKRVVN